MVMKKLKHNLRWS